MKATIGMTLSRTDMAAYCGIDPKTLDAWVRDGCPIARTGSRGVAAEYNSADVWRWREERLRAKLVAPVQQKRDELEIRKLEAQTEAAELDLAKAKDEVAPVAEFEAATARLMAAVRTNMLNVVRRAQLALLGESDSATFSAKMRELIVEALESSAADADAEADPELIEDETEL